MPATLELSQQLIACPSITPDDGGCQEIIGQRLQALGFKLEAMPFGEVKNLWAKKGTDAPLVVFAGHTDVVPPGPLTAWTSDPFQPSIRDGLLYGRGAADMKSGLAAMVVAAEEFIQTHPDYKGSIGFLITSDEEGPSVHGTKAVMEELTRRGEKIQFCVIGESTSEKTLGDVIRVGRRGSLHGKLTVHGIQGHIAHPHRAKNPIHLVAPAIAELTSTVWDEGNEFFPPTTFQISNIHSGTGATNIIPGILELLFNFRFSTAVTPDELQERVQTILHQHHLEFAIEWNVSGLPFLTQHGKLVTATEAAIKEFTGLNTELSTGGGTSDGRFIAPTGAEVVELGPINLTAHQVNEHVRVDDLELLTKIYQRILQKLLAIPT